MGPGPRPSQMIGNIPNPKDLTINLSHLSHVKEDEKESESSSDSEGKRSDRDSEQLIEQTNPTLYERGKIADTFYLILSGHVEIKTGNEMFKVSYAKYNYLGEHALEKNNYKPDFTAKVQKKAKLLAITKKAYLKKKQERY